MKTFIEKTDYIANKTLKEKTILIGLVILGSFIMGCGSSKTPLNNNSASNSSRLPDSTLASDLDGPISNCGGAANDSLDLSFQMSTYVVPSTNQVLVDYIRMNFAKVPSKIFNTNTTYIQMFKWLSESTGDRVVNDKAIGFYFQNRQTGKIINPSEPQTRISQAVIKNMMALAQETGATNLSVDGFLKQHILILTGMSLEYDAISVAVYDSSNSSDAIGFQDALIPSFYANPNDYEATHASLDLQELHPNWSYRSSNLTDEQFHANAQAYCYF